MPNVIARPARRPATQLATYARALVLACGITTGAAREAAAQLPARETSDAAREIRRLRESSNGAIARHDTAGIGAVLAPGVLILTSNSVATVGRDAAVARFAEQFRGRPDVTYRRTPVDVEVFVPWRMASEAGEWSGSWTDGDVRVEVGGRYFAKWRVIDGAWRIESETYVPTRCRGGRYCAIVP